MLHVEIVHRDSILYRKTKYITESTIISSHNMSTTQNDGVTIKHKQLNIQKNRYLQRIFK